MTGRLAEQVLSTLQAREAAGVLLDASGLTQFDPQTLHSLSMLSKSIELMGARAVLIGLRPPLIQALVDTRLELAQIATARDLAGGLASLWRA